MMITTQQNISYGAQPLKTLQGGGVPGLKPRRGPLNATGGPLTLSCPVRGQGTGVKATDHQEDKTINIIQWNAEGVYQKKTPLMQRLKKEDVDVACIQETHLKEKHRFRVEGYQAFRHDRKRTKKGGVLILVKNSIPAQDFIVETNEQAEIQGVKIKIGDRQLKIFNIYSPQNTDLSLDLIQIEDKDCLVLGDFNSHSEAWGYKEADARGEQVEDWQVDTKLVLLNDPDDPPSFFSRTWLKSYTPDLAFATNDLAGISSRTVLAQLGGSDHRPIRVSFDLGYKPKGANTLPRWNYKRANWERFSDLTDLYSLKINNTRENLNTKIKSMNRIILQAAKETIPRGARKNYQPYWSEELQQQEDAVEEARLLVEENGTIENNIAFKAASAKHTQTYIQGARNSWHKKTSELNLDKDSHKLWNLARSLSDENNRSSPITLEKEGKLISGRECANAFIDHYSSASDLKVTTERQREILQAQENDRDLTIEPGMDKPFITEELDDALRFLPLKKSPGPDEITNEMLINLGPKCKKKLLQLFNDGWRTGTVPQIWREAIMIPVHKAGKDKSKAENYRPISLTSCMGKLMERLINTRLMWHLEKKQHIKPEQAAFRQNRSTEDQVTYVSQAIEDAFQDQKHALVVWIDLEKAFDKVWREGLKRKLRQCGVGGRMYKWIGQYLQNRKARVQVKQHLSQKKDIRQGVPQGGVLSPTLFLIFIGDIISRLPRNVKGAIYADDLALWCSEEHIGTAQHRLQLALNEIATWANSWLVKINEKKTTYTVFTLSTKPQKANLSINGVRLQEESTPTYLGVTLDKRLSWKAQIQKNQTKAKLRLALMKKLCGTGWGADQNVLKKLYIGSVRPVLEYGMAATSTASYSNTMKLTRIQNQAMRMMTGAMRTTPITSLETTTGLQPIKDRREEKVLSQAAKFRRLEDHPMNQRMRQPTKSRLKSRTSFIHHSRDLERDVQSHIPKPIAQADVLPPWERSCLPKICTSIPGIRRKGHQSDLQRKHLALDYIHSYFPEHQWTHAYTDGSAVEAVREGGSGVYIKYQDEPANIRLPTGQISTNFNAEAEALKAAALDISRNLGRVKPKVVIFTDALSVLQALQNSKKKDLDELVTALTRLAGCTTVTLQWIPAHCGIQGNEIADRLAKEAGQLEQVESKISFADERTLIKSRFSSKWKQEHPGYNQHDGYYSLDRSEQVLLFRLRTGHNRLNDHMYRILQIGRSEMCPCNTAPMTSAHVLQDCPSLGVTRRDIWPQPTPLEKKLFGNLTDLRRTVRFVQKSGLII